MRSAKMDFDREELEQAFEPETAPAQAVRERIELDVLQDALEGRPKGSLRSSKPDADGLTQYVWRTCRLANGSDPSMPVMAASWLQDYLDAEGIDASVSGVLDDAGKEITRLLDAVAAVILLGFGENPEAGARIWKQSGAF